MIKYWIVDSFTDKPFKGNPAAVVLLEEDIPTQFLQNIAMEFNLPETAFIIKKQDNSLMIRWFTPTIEMDLCGHATLAATHIYFTEIQDINTNQPSDDTQRNKVIFDTQEVGKLIVTKIDDGYTMDFPIRKGEEVKIDSIPQYVLDSLSQHKPLQAFQSRDLMLVYENEKIIEEMTPDFSTLKQYNSWVIVTAKSQKYDFISRFFCAEETIPEDPVTGSAHCTLAPYWQEKLNKNKLLAYQKSARGGTLHLEVIENKNTVKITGQAITVVTNGKIII